MGASLVQPCRVYEEPSSLYKVLFSEEGVVVNNHSSDVTAEKAQLTPCQQPRGNTEEVRKRPSELLGVKRTQAVCQVGCNPGLNLGTAFETEACGDIL